MDYSAPFLTQQLIAYIGNKRRLLPFLGDVFKELSSESGAGTAPLRFCDPFAGSGSVSRLAKLMGFSVSSNDWEMYSYLINTAHLCCSPQEADRLFIREGGLGPAVDELNRYGRADAVTGRHEPYISRYYAPDETETADYHKERLFYTHENAVFIDRIRHRIDELYPNPEEGSDDFYKKALLVAPLLYQAATHANTNGVFKACHKGFGGHGKDALTRIMANMELRVPLLVPGAANAAFSVSRQDASDCAASEVWDICYLDPPYNQHQYGSNYFMLNTIAAWDRPDVSMERHPDGTLMHKAGIRPDWVETRSPFCYEKTAPQALRRLLENSESRYFVLSYNTEGIIPFDVLCSILSDFGSLQIFCSDYVIYRGGKQSLGRNNRNVEYQLVVNTAKKYHSSDLDSINEFLIAKKIISAMNESFNPERLKEKFMVDDDSAVLLSDTVPELKYRTYRQFRFKEVPSAVQLLGCGREELLEISGALEYSRCRDKKEEADVLLSLIENARTEGSDSSEIKKLWKLLLATVRKFAFRKYREDFEYYFNRMSVLSENFPEKRNMLNKELSSLRHVAGLRFSR